jgi:hypothetical protein
MSLLEQEYLHIFIKYFHLVFIIKSPKQSLGDLLFLLRFLLSLPNNVWRLIVFAQFLLIIIIILILFILVILLSFRAP